MYHIISFQIGDNRITEIASDNRQHFASEDDRFTSLPNAGLRLQNSKLEDAGTYLVRISSAGMDSVSSFSIIQRTVQLNVGMFHVSMISTN